MCSQLVLTLVPWASDMAANFVGTVLGAGVLVTAGARWGLPWVEDWRAARSVICHAEPIPGKADVTRVTADNHSTTAITGMVVLWVDPAGQEHHERMEGPERDFQAPRDRTAPGESATATIGNLGGIRSVSVVFIVSGGRYYRRELGPGRRLTRWYEKRYGQWGRWEFLRRRLRVARWRLRELRAKRA
jgi:hypothetical protein